MANDEIGKAEIFKLTGEILTAHVTHNSVPAGDLARLISSVHEALSQAANPQPEAGYYYEEPAAEPEAAAPPPEPPQLAPPMPLPALPPGAVIQTEREPEQVPMVPINESIHDGYIVCLECGREMQMLRAHVQKKHGLSFDEYRRKWRLPRKYPAIAPNYREERARINREMGTGQHMVEVRRAIREASRLDEAEVRELPPPLPEPEPEPVVPAGPVPAVPIEESVTPDYLTCLDCGARLKTIKLHIKRSHGLSPDAYRAKWGLPGNYPMTSANLLATLTANAKNTDMAEIARLGRQAQHERRAAAAETPPAPTPKEPAVPIEESVQPDWVACLECGQRLKTITMHLRLRHHTNPHAYRAKWGLPDDYPMQAPNLSALQSDAAKEQQVRMKARRAETLVLDQPIGKTRQALLKESSDGKS